MRARSRKAATSMEKRKQRSRKTIVDLEPSEDDMDVDTIEEQMVQGPFVPSGSQQKE
jgi:hypothetical protein